MQYQPFLPEVASGTIDPRAVVVPLRRVLRHCEVVIGEVERVDHASRRASVRLPDGRRDLARLRRRRARGRVLGARAPDPRARGACGGVQDRPGGDLAAQPGVVAPGPRRGGRRPGAPPRGPDVRLRRRRLRGGRGARRARGPRARRGAELPGSPASRAAVGPRRGRGPDPPRARTGPGRLRARAAARNAGSRCCSGPASTPRRAGWSGSRTDRRSRRTPSCGRRASSRRRSRRRSGFPVDGDGRVRTDAYLRVEGVEDAWAAGDAAAVPDLGRAARCPRPRSTGCARADTWRATSSRRSRGRRLEPFDYRGIGSVCSLGRYKGVATIFGVRLRGFPAWFAHRSYHLLAMPTLTRKVKIAADWTVALLFPRDLAQLGSLEHPREPFERAAGSTPADPG